MSPMIDSPRRLSSSPTSSTASPAAALAGDPWPDWAIGLHEGWLAFRVRLEAWLQALHLPPNGQARWDDPGNGPSRIVAPPGDASKGDTLQAGSPHPERPHGGRSVLELSYALCLQISHWHCEWVQSLPLSGPDLAIAQALVERTQAWLRNEALIDTLDQITMTARRPEADSSPERVPAPSMPASLRDLLIQSLGELTLLLSMAPGLSPLAGASSLSPTARTALTPPSHPDAAMGG